MSIDMSQFYQVFFEESAEHLAEMERLLLAIDIGCPDIEEMNAIFRAAHSIKGGSGTFGFTDMTEVTHVLESLLDRLRKGEMPLGADMIDVFLEAIDVLKDQLSAHVQGIIGETAAAKEVCVKLQHLALNEGSPGTESAEDAALPTEGRLPPEDDGTPVSSTDKEGGMQALHDYEILFQPGKAFRKRPGAMEALIAELASLGEVAFPDDGLPEEQRKSKKGEQDKKRKKNKKEGVLQKCFQVRTAAATEELEEIFDLIASPDEVTITARVQEKDLDSGSSGFTALVAGSAPFTHGSESSFTSTAPVDGSADYGFFVDLPPQASSEDGDGFGFFEPLTPPTESEKEDFGFFEPVGAERQKSSELPPSSISAAGSVKPKGRAVGTAPLGDTSIRVSIERVDQLINLVGELVITQAMLAQIANGVDPVLHEALNRGMAQLERNTRDLQESVMSIRMLPISFVFSRFPRVVRDLANKLNKQVELVTIGEATELDKGLIEKIADPLTHLVRNSLDHGIELPEVRTATGKPAQGTITLSASHQGGNIVIEVTDDGAGLNRERILNKAAERGFNVSEAMSDGDVWMLIFEPGFSTAEVVTDVSGRGVGMDVVKRNITEMGGVVTISSTAGRGSTITIRLPLTLAILDGMSVSLGDSLYVIPLNMIVETLQPRPEDIKTVTGQGHMVEVRGEYLPIIALHSVFDMVTAVTDPCQGVLVLIEAEGKKAALFVDALVGQQQVVIKSLETNFRKVAGISGATIMGDGTVALILDVSTLIKIGQ